MCIVHHSFKRNNDLRKRSVTNKKIFDLSHHSFLQVVLQTELHYLQLEKIVFNARAFSPASITKSTVFNLTDLSISGKTNICIF